MSRNGIVQWGWRDMEELLQCPVCLDIPSSGAVEQCRHGHHICASCKKNVDTCPLCKCEFHGTRNFILEELVRHFDILKNTMLLNNLVCDSKKKFKSKKLMERDDPPTSLLKGQPARRLVHTPKCTKGTYPCRAEDCDVVLPLGRLLNHARSLHGDILTESIVDFTDVFTHTFEVPLLNKKPLNKNSFVVFVSGIGLIYLNIEVMRSGQLLVFLQMASKFNKCQEYLASIQLFSETNSYLCNIRLVSSRLCFSKMLEDCICFTLNKNQLRKICENKKFNCKLTLTRFDVLNVNVLTQPNRDQIRVIAGIRASLIHEQFDKKLVNQLEAPPQNKKVVHKGAPSTSEANSKTAELKQILKDVFGAMNVVVSKNDVAVTSLNNSVTLPSSANTRITQGLTGRQNKKKKSRRPNGI